MLKIHLLRAIFMRTSNEIHRTKQGSTYMFRATKRRLNTNLVPAYRSWSAGSMTRTGSHAARKHAEIQQNIEETGRKQGETEAVFSILNNINNRKEGMSLRLRSGN
jgi:hypothetical protein